MPIRKQTKVIALLCAAGIRNVDRYTPFPRSYCANPSSVKAIYLGCDPSNKGEKRFCYAFALPDGDEYGFGRFVSGHEASLKSIGLTWNKVYAQNLCQNYFTKETSENLKNWKRAAELWIPILKEELRTFSGEIPVLLTAEELYRILLKPGENPTKAKDFYNGKAPVPISPELNRLGRPLIPFYRHRNYQLSKWLAYATLVSKLVNGGETL